MDFRLAGRARVGSLSGFVGLCVALGMVGCGPSLGPPERGTLAAIGSTRVRLTVEQYRIGVEAVTPGGTPGPSLVLSGMSLANSVVQEIKRARTADNLVGAMGISFDFRDEMLARLRGIAPRLRSLNVKRVDAGASPLTKAERNVILGEGPEDAVLEIASEYAFSPYLLTLMVATKSEIWVRGNGQPAYVGAYEYWSPPVDSCETMEACADAWSAGDALLLRRALEEGIDETLRMLALDLGAVGATGGGPAANLNFGPLTTKDSFSSYVANEGSRYIVRRSDGRLLSASTHDVFVPRAASQ